MYTVPNSLLYINVFIDRQIHFDACIVELDVLYITKATYWIQFLGVTQHTLQCCILKSLMTG